MIKEEIDLLLAANKGAGYHKCVAAYVIDQFEGDDREAIIRLLDSTIVTTKVIQYLATKSVSMTPQSLTKHRRRIKGTGCACPVEL